MELGTRPDIRNTKEEETKTTEKIQRSNLQKTPLKISTGPPSGFFLLFFFLFFTITIHKSQTENMTFSVMRKKIRSSCVTTRDGCCIPLKGHGSKTNNESRAVLPPLQKEEKKSFGEFKKLCGIFCYFSS